MTPDYNESAGEAWAADLNRGRAMGEFVEPLDRGIEGEWLEPDDGSSSPSRFCQNPGCRAPIDHLKSTAKYCGPTCRGRAAEKRALGIFPGYDPEAFWTGYSGVRRSQALRDAYSSPRGDSA